MRSLRILSDLVRRRMSVSSIHSGVMGYSAATPSKEWCLSSAANKVKSAVASVFAKIASVMDLGFMETLAATGIALYFSPKQSFFPAIATGFLLGAGLVASASCVTALVLRQ